MKIFWEVFLPIKTVSEANCSDHFIVKSKRHKMQKKWIRLAYMRDKPILPKKATISITRIAPKTLDADDNLPMALKYVKDYIADLIFPGLAAGRADDSKDLTWVYSQEKGKTREYGVKIKIYEDI